MPRQSLVTSRDARSAALRVHTTPRVVRRYCACGCGQLLPRYARRETKYLRACFLNRSLVDARLWLSHLPLDDAIRAIRKSAYDQGKLSGAYYERQRARAAFARYAFRVHSSLMWKGRTAMGFSWKRFIQVAQIVGPAALTVAGVPAALIPLVVHGIQIAEATSAQSDTPMTGPEKKALALDVIHTGLAGVNAAVEKTVVDVDQLSTVAGDAIDLAVKATKAAQNIPVHNPV